LSTIQKVRNQIRELLSYLWIAAVATLVNVASGVVYRELFGIDYRLSYALGYGTGMIVGFSLSKLFSFKQRTSTNTKTEGIKFVMVTLIAFLVTYNMSLLFHAGFSVLFDTYPDFHDQVLDLNRATQQKWLNRDLIANIMGIGIGFFVNFFGHKFLTFRKTDAINRIRRRVTI